MAPSWGTWEALLESIFGSCRGLGGPEAIGKGFGRAWVGSGAAGDSDLGPTWTQLEPSWSQLGASMEPT